MSTNTSTEGLRIHTKSRWLSEAVEIFSSMRFAISLLTLIAIASIIGTVLKQNEPMPNYINQFGPFWFDVFSKLGLYSVYSTWWFLLIMGLLVLSTSLCITRNAPKMLKDVRSWREHVREESLRNFHHHLEWSSQTTRASVTQETANRLAAEGYQVKRIEKDDADLIAAKRGAGNKWGYIFAHSAIVIICVGGLLDSNLPIRLQEWLFNKTPFNGNGVIAEIPPEHRLGLGNPSFRGNTMIPEGNNSSTAILQQSNGVLIQDLPITIQLKKFIIDYYSTGMPKLFASEIVVRDNATGESFPATIKVNEPLIYKGLAVYQSGFDDGGSKLKLAGYPMAGTQDKSFDLEGQVGGNTAFGKNEYTIEWSGFRAFNVENMAQPGQDVRAVAANKSVFNDLDKQFGSGAKHAKDKNLRNVGPSVQYKLRDKSGQAREYHNYMVPVEIDGMSVFLAGMRSAPDEPFRFLRIPADDNGKVDEWMHLRAALADPAKRELAAHRYAQHAIGDGRDKANVLREQLAQSALKGLTVFAGDGQDSGYIAVSKLLEKLPTTDQEKAANIFMKVLNGAMWELWQISRETNGLPKLTIDEKHARFLQVATNTLSDVGLYGAPVYLQLTGFDEVKASVFQVTRSPGKRVVYFGCLLLVLGVFAMFFIRERRVWVWLKNDDQGGTHALMAMSTQRRTLDFEREFEQMKTRLSTT